MILTDTGPLVALINRNDPNHIVCLAAAKRLPQGPLLTTWPCLTEAMHLLFQAVSVGRSGRFVPAALPGVAAQLSQQPSVSHTMLRYLVNLLKPLRMIDPVFGNLRYRRAGFWEGTCYFLPLDKTLDITIHAGRGGPTTDHYDFFHNLTAQYELVVANVAPLLLEQAQNWSEDFLPSELWTFFDLQGISIPNPTPQPITWELQYWCEAAGHSFDIWMQDWMPHSLSVNG